MHINTNLHAVYEMVKVDKAVARMVDVGLKVLVLVDDDMCAWI